MTTTLTNPDTSSRTLCRKRLPALDLEPVTREEFACLEKEWDAFHVQTQIPSPFQSWDYLDCWWQTYGGSGYDVKMFVARDTSGQLVGAAPLMLTRKGAFPGNRGKFRHLAFMGGVGELLGESLELPALPGYERALGEATADLVATRFQGQWDAAYFYLVPETSVSANAMLTRLAHLGVAARPTSSLPSPYIAIDGTWDGHIAARPTKFARRVRYIQSYAVRHFDMKLNEVREASQVDRLIDHLVRLAGERWGGESQAFHTPGFTAFHRAYAPRAFAKNKLACALLEMKGEVAGAAYNFIYANKMWGYQVPWDVRFKAGRPGNVLHIWSAKTAFDLGLREHDTLPGDAGYKDEWTTGSHTLNIYEAACPRTFGGTMFRLARGIDRILHHKPQPGTTP